MADAIIKTSDRKLESIKERAHRCLMDLQYLMEHDTSEELRRIAFALTAAVVDESDDMEWLTQIAGSVARREWSILEMSEMHPAYSRPTSQYRHEKLVWKNMIRRCHVPACADYKWYGARGISVCDEWRRDFMAFYNHVGPRPEGLSIDRINNDGNYEPGNVRWTTAAVQSQNRRRSTWKQERDSASLIG